MIFKSQLLNSPQKFSIGELVKLQGEKDSPIGKVKDIKWVYNEHLYEYTWGYFVDWEDQNVTQEPIEIVFIPQMYLMKILFTG